MRKDVLLDLLAGLAVVLISCVAAATGIFARRSWAAHRIGSIVGLAAMLTVNIKHPAKAGTGDDLAAAHHA